MLRKAERPDSRSLGYQLPIGLNFRNRAEPLSTLAEYGTGKCAIAAIGGDLRRRRRRCSACDRKPEIGQVELAARHRSLAAGSASAEQSRQRRLCRTTDISVSLARRSRNARTKRSTQPRKPSSIGIAEGKAPRQKQGPDLPVFDRLRSTATTIAGRAITSLSIS